MTSRSTSASACTSFAPVPVAAVEESSPLRGIEFESRREEEEEERSGRMRWRFEFGDNAEDVHTSDLEKEAKRARIGQ
jgi:hypothetical protein